MTPSHPRFDYELGSETRRKSQELGVETRLKVLDM